MEQFGGLFILFIGISIYLLFCDGERIWKLFISAKLTERGKQFWGNLVTSLVSGWLVQSRFITQHATLTLLFQIAYGYFFLIRHQKIFFSHSTWKIQSRLSQNCKRFKPAFHRDCIILSSCFFHFLIKFI